MPIVRTPDECFAHLPGYPFAPHYADLDGVRMHYVDEAGPDADATETILCLHGEPSWSYLYRKMMPILSARCRVVAPDLIGFGRSDKFTEPDDYTYAMHARMLARCVEALNLQRITL
ncbi:MAG: alpha/beta fold hydrolase, partial [Ktedonobacterales bacterium]